MLFINHWLVFKLKPQQNVNHWVMRFFFFFFSFVARIASSVFHVPPPPPQWGWGISGEGATGLAGSAAHTELSHTQHWKLPSSDAQVKLQESPRKANASQLCATHTHTSWVTVCGWHFHFMLQRLKKCWKLHKESSRRPFLVSSMDYITVQLTIQTWRSPKFMNMNSDCVEVCCLESQTSRFRI